MPGVKTNEREGTRAVLRHGRISASKVRQVLDLIRGEDVDRAAEILDLTGREAADLVSKVLASAVANAVHNDGLDAEDLYVSACYADEGGTLKRWRPRARGRATRIRKRTCHVTIIVSRLPEERIARRRAKQAASTAQRSRRVAGSRRRPRAEQAQATTTGTAPVATDDIVDVDRGDEPDEQSTGPEAEPTDRGDRDRGDRVRGDRRGDRRRGDRRGRGALRGDAGRRRRERRGEGRVDGPEGKPVRVPTRRHHRLEVALVRGAQLLRTA